MISRLLQFVSRWFLLILPSSLVGNSLRSRQTALLRVLAMSHREGIDPRITVSNLAVEQSGKYAGRLRDLVSWIAAKSSLSTALANTPGALDDDDTLAIQCGIETEQLGDTFNYLIHDSRDRGENNAIQAFHGSVFYLFTTFCFTMLVLTASFTFIVPTFEQIFEEFDLELPQSMLALISFSNRFAWLLPLLLLMVLAFTFLSFFRDFRAGITRLPLLRDLPWVQHRRVAGLLRVLSVPCQNGSDVGPTITAAAEFHKEARCRTRLLNAKTSSANGEDLWSQLARQSLIQPNTATQLQRITDPRLKAWALRALADQKREKASYQTEWLARWLELIPVLLMGLFIGWMVIAVMTTLTNLTHALA